MKFTITQKELKNLARFCAAPSMHRPALENIFLEVKNGMVRLCATNGAALIVIEKEGEKLKEGDKFLLPVDLYKDLKPSGIIEIEWNEGTGYFTGCDLKNGGGRLIIPQPMEKGPAPNFDLVLKDLSKAELAQDYAIFKPEYLKKAADAIGYGFYNIVPTTVGKNHPHFWSIAGTVVCLMPCRP